MAKNNFVKVELEPSYNLDETCSELKVMESLTWYHYNKTEKDAAKYLGVEAKIAKNNLTYAWITRMRVRGFKFSEKSEQYIETLKQRFDVYNSNNKKVELDDDGNFVATVPVISLQERITAKTDQHIGELEGMIDEYGYGMKSFNAYDWFSKNDVKPVHATKIIEYFQNRLYRFVTEVKGKDTREYYSTFSKAKIKSIITVMESIVKDAGRLSQNINKTRKPRKKKTVTFEKQVSKLKFLDKDNNFKIQSINPVSIVGADQLWVFNVKTRKLGVYIAADAAGLLVKGSTIENFAKMSISKTLRKPEKTLTTVLEGGKIAIRKVMESINSKETELNGRINKDTILLRVVRQ